VGSIFPYHGVEMLVSAFKKDYVNSEGVGLLIVGAGVGLNDLMKNNTEYKNIIFTGNINSDNIPSHINLMDICVMARSNWYGSPVKIFEYGAYKKPVIVPRVSPVLEIIDSEIDGIFVDSEGELITAMKRLIEDKTKRVLMGEALHRKIIEKHTWKKNAIRILSDLI
jgi:glycosyltransferase involved in cell wall biosynthesis